MATACEWNPSGPHGFWLLILTNHMKWHIFLLHVCVHAWCVCTYINHIFQLRFRFSILIEWFLSLLKLFLLSPLLSPIIFFNTYTHFSVAFSAYASGLLFQKTKKKVLSVSCIIRISSVRVIRVLLFSLIFFDSVKVVGPLAKDIYLGDSVNHK